MKSARCLDLTLTAQKQLRPKESYVLRIVDQHGGCSRHRLAELADLSPNTMGSYLYDLSRAELVHCRGYGRGASWWPGAAPPAVVQLVRNVPLNSVWSMAA